MVNKIIASIKDRTLVRKVKHKIVTFLVLFFVSLKNQIDYEYYHLHVKRKSHYPPLDMIKFDKMRNSPFSRKALLVLKDSHPQIYSNLIYYATKHQGLEKYNIKDYNAFIESVKETEFNDLKPISLLALSRFSLNVGAYELSKFFRDAYLRIVFDKNRRNTFEKTSYVLGSFDSLANQNLIAYKQILDAKTLQYFDILNGLTVSCEYQPKDVNFYNDIKDKRIAIIGPTTDDALDIKQLLNEFEYLVLMNYKDISPIEKEISKEKLISYYNPPNLLVLHKSNKEDILGAPKYSVFAPAFGGSAEEIQQRNIASKTNCRKLISYHKYYLMGYPNMLQYIIFDLLTFNPKQLKIFNVNFFLSYQSYDRSYIIEHESKKTIFDRWHSHATHNVLSQYRLTRNLLSHPKISFSEKVFSVLNLGEEEYLKQMKREYVDKFLR